MTVRDLITGSFRLLGVLASGEQPAANEMQDAFASLNSMLDSWKLERLMVYAILPQTFSLVAGKKTYTIGTGGDFDTDWPTRIEKIQLNYNTGGVPINLPIEILNLDQYQQFTVPDTTSTIPQWMYPDDAYPLRSLSFYPVPSIVNTVDIFTWGLINGFASIDDDIVLPPGYELALKSNLALQIAPEFGIQQINPITAAMAADSRAKIKSFNMKPLFMEVDSALTSRGGYFDWRTGQIGSR